MLGKLFKNEFKTTYKPVLIMFAVTIILTVINSVATRIGLSPKELSGLPIVLYISRFFRIISILSLVFLSLVCFIYCCGQFYKTMYSAQGYLTHTLPVSPVATFWVKVTTTLVWLICSFVVLALCIAELGLASIGENIFSGFFELFKHFNELKPQLDASIRETFGISFWGFVAFFILFTLVQLISIIFFVYTSMTIGQLSCNHKIGTACLSGIVLYFGSQIFSIAVAVKVYSALEDVAFESAPVPETIMSIFWFFVLIKLFIIIVEAALDSIIVHRKINLQ